MSIADFVKLYGAKLLRSTLWHEPPEVQLVFVGVALADWDGVIEAPRLRVLAHAPNLPVDYV